MRLKMLITLVMVGAMGAGWADRGPIGTGAAHAAPLAASCALGLSDAEAIAELHNLADLVAALEASGSLNRGQARALENRLVSAERRIEAGGYCPAGAQLRAFGTQVETRVYERVLTQGEADPLIAGVTRILNGPSADSESAGDEEPFEVPEGYPNLVTVERPSAGAGIYGAFGATFGPRTTVDGIGGQVALADDGSANPTLACNSLVGFPAGAIAVVDLANGQCVPLMQVWNAQMAGAVAVVVVNHEGRDMFTLDAAATFIHIPSVLVSHEDGGKIKGGLPAEGLVHRTP
jgi:hypothetical protein